MICSITGILIDTKIYNEEENDKILLFVDDIVLNDSNITSLEDFSITAEKSKLKFIENFSLRKLSCMDVVEVNCIVRGIFLKKRVFIKALMDPIGKIFVVIELALD